jgi:hypothetical protein
VVGAAVASLHSPETQVSGLVQSASALHVVGVALATPEQMLLLAVIRLTAMKTVAIVGRDTWFALPVIPDMAILLAPF